MKTADVQERALPPPFTLRSAQVSDAAGIVEVYAPYVLSTPVTFEVTPPSPDLMSARIAASLPTHPWIIAEVNQRVLGYAYAVPHSQRPGYRWTVDVTIYVGQDFLRQGIGWELYRVLLQSLREQGFRSAFAEIVLPNSGSVRLHEAFDFKAIGIHADVGYKLGSWRAIGYWRLALSQGLPALPEPVPFAEFKLSNRYSEIIHRPTTNIPAHFAEGK